MHKNILFVLIIATIFLYGCSASTQSTTNLIQNVEECQNSTLVHEFMNRTYALADANTTACEYKFLGYGGAYTRNVTVATQNGKVRTTTFFSGMGSGGHGYITYCLTATSPIDFANITSYVCNKLTYKLADFRCENITDITQSFVAACNNGLFTVDVNGTKVFSVTQRTSRCASFVEIGTYSCASESVNTTAIGAEIDALLPTAQ